MQIFIGTVLRIIKNKYFWHTVIVMLGLTIYFNIGKGDFPTVYTFLAAFFLILYATYTSLKFLYEITSVKKWKLDVTFGEFFWLLFGFSLVFSLLFGIPFAIIFFKFMGNGDAERLKTLNRVFLFPKEIIELLYALSSIVVIGTRSTDTIIKNIKELLHDFECRRLFLFFCAFAVIDLCINLFAEFINYYFLFAISILLSLLPVVLFLKLVEQFQILKFDSRNSIE
ncbi:hypothetical protein [Leptospira koniambonensis]